MKILALSDRVVDSIYSAQLKDTYGDVDLVIGCGDLPYSYLEYIVTLLPIPVLYVHGNHDKVQYAASGRVIAKPTGCIPLDGEVKRINGLIVAGLGGSIRYRPNAEHQYSEGQMRGRILRLAPRLLMNRLLYGRFLDILVTHSPPLGIHDGPDYPHTGFKSFLTFMRYFKPVYMLHGHKHVYRRGETTQSRFGATTVINVYPKRLLTWPPEREHEQAVTRIGEGGERLSARSR
jgi:Icc-related predicted phosphoesterase